MKNNKYIDKEINLLRSLPLAKRNITKRKDQKKREVIIEAKKFDFNYWDGPREYGYGGYKYDGRWIPVARDIVNNYALKSEMKVLDVGCAKGFLIKDLLTVLPGLEVFGLDVSSYALMHCEKEVIGDCTWVRQKAYHSQIKVLIL